VRARIMRRPLNAPSLNIEKALSTFICLLPYFYFLERNIVRGEAGTSKGFPGCIIDRALAEDLKVGAFLRQAAFTLFKTFNYYVCFRNEI
jgi:hypothetical protein